MTVREIKEPPNADAIETLGEAIKRARSGEIRGFLLLTENTDRTVSAVPAGKFDMSAVSWAYKMWELRAVLKCMTKSDDEDDE